VQVESELDDPVYLADVFVRDASLVRITPFMLDAYAREYQDTVREREAHAIEMDSLRNTNRHLTAQVSVGFSVFKRQYFNDVHIVNLWRTAWHS
jgi:hypothetical protein